MDQGSSLRMVGFFKGTITPNLDILIASKCLTIHRRTHPYLSIYNLTPDPTRELECSFSFDNAFDTPIGSELKFYNLHQTLNISINVLKSFTDIYCISSARSGFVFFISFTSFFLILIMSPSYIILDVLSSLLLGAWSFPLLPQFAFLTLAKQTRKFGQGVSYYHGSWPRSRGQAVALT